MYSHEWCMTIMNSCKENWREMHGVIHNREGKSNVREVSYKREINRGRGKFILSWLMLASMKVVVEVFVPTRRVIKEW